MDITVVSRHMLREIAEIEKLCFPEPWSERSLEIFDGGASFAVAASENEKIVSYCTVVTVLDEAQIINLATRPEYRGRGLAEKIMDKVISECASRKIGSLSLEVRVSNFKAISLYKKCGFTVAGERKDFYKDPRENAFVMVKKL